MVNHAVTLSSGQEFLLDLAFLAVRLALEVDGWAFHSTPDRFVRDRARKRALVADGWVVAEVTWDDLLHRPEQVLDENPAHTVPPRRRMSPRPTKITGTTRSWGRGGHGLLASVIMERRSPVASRK